MVATSGAFGDLRKLAEWFSTSPQHASLHITRITRRLGTTAVPLLGRELSSADPRRRDAARDCLAQVGAMPPARERVIVELRRVLEHATADELRVCVLGLLAELGEHAEARFDDPRAMQRRSALALAAQLHGDADVAHAVDLMVRTLDRDDIAQMIEVLVESAPEAAHQLAHELHCRLDLDLEIRERVVALTGHAPLDTTHHARRTPRPTQVAVLVDAAARIVVVASRKISGERRWRRWAVLVDPTGRIDDCLHEEATPRHGADADAAPLVAGLLADGYRIASTDLDHARTVVGGAARLTASRSQHDPQALTPAYYLGRDLLDLRDVHMGPRRDASTILLARAVDLIDEGECTRALALLDQAAASGDRTADHAAAVAACALAQGRFADAVEPLTRAIALEPAWPLHHWNLAAASHAVGDLPGCYHALRRFLATSARPTALHGDPDQLARVAFAERTLVELERAARLAGLPLTRRRRARKHRSI